MLSKEAYIVIKARVDYYNSCRRHSSLEYQSPLAALRQMRLDCQGARDLG